MSDRNKRVAIFIPSMRSGGAQRSMLKLARGIAERGFAVDLVLAQAVGPYLAEAPESVRLVNLNSRRTFASLPILVQYLRRERPGTVLSALNSANIIALWARHLANVPTRIVISERNTLSVDAQHALNWRARQMPKLARRFYPWADGIVAVSKGVACDLVQVANIPHDRVKVIYNPIVTPELREKVNAPLDHLWFKSTHPPVVLAAGRLTLQKDFPTLIRAFAKVRSAHPSRLLILGEGEERRALEALIKQLRLEDDVSLPGFVANPYAYMARASLFVLSSKWEGLPGVLIEALYCGTPLIATDCPSGPREILADGRYGQLVPVGDVTALAQAVERALIGNTPRPPPESWQHFALETVVDQYLNILWES